MNSQTVCRLCNTPIEGVEGQRTILVLGRYLGPTVHQRCMDKLEAEKATKEPYRHPLGRGRITPKIKDWDCDDSDESLLRLPYADDK